MAQTNLVHHPSNDQDNIEDEPVDSSAAAGWKQINSPLRDQAAANSSSPLSNNNISSNNGGEEEQKVTMQMVDDEHPEQVFVAMNDASDSKAKR